MAINSTGKVSLAGTVAGESVELELGGNGSTIISLNDANVRAFLGISSGVISLNDAHGKSSGSYWIALQSGVGMTTTTNRAIACDASGNVYINAQVYANTSYYALLVKLDKDGNLVNQRQCNNVGGGNAFSFYNTTIDTTGTYLLRVGEISRTSTRENCSLSRYLLSDLTTVDHLYWTATPTSDQSFYGVSIANSSLMYVVGSTGLVVLNGESPTSTIITRAIYTSGATFMVTSDSSNAYMVQNGSTLAFTKIQKVNSSGTPSAALVSTGVYPQQLFEDIDFNKTSSTLAVSYLRQTALSAFNGIGVAQLNSTTLSPNWIKVLTGLTTNLQIGTKTIIQDNSGNIYAMGVDTSAFKTVIAKWNSSGTLQWQRTISFAGDTSVAGRFSMTYSNEQNALLLYIGDYSTTQAFQLFVFKLNPDGSNVGTYSLGTKAITIAASSYVESTITFNTTTTTTSPTTPTSQPQATNSGAQTAGPLTYSTLDL